jgi:hypothetical protein
MSAKQLKMANIIRNRSNHFTFYLQKVSLIIFDIHVTTVIKERQAVLKSEFFHDGWRQGVEQKGEL